MLSIALFLLILSSSSYSYFFLFLFLISYSYSYSYWHWHPTNRCWRAETLLFRFHWGNWILSHQNHCAGETRNFGLQTFKKKFIVFILWKEIPCVHSWHFARSDFLSVWRRLEDTILRSLARRGWSSRCFVITHLCWDRYLWIFLSWLFSTEIYIQGQSG